MPVKKPKSRSLLDYAAEDPRAHSRYLAATAKESGDWVPRIDAALAPTSNSAPAIYEEPNGMRLARALSGFGAGLQGKSADETLAYKLSSQAAGNFVSGELERGIPLSKIDPKARRYASPQTVSDFAQIVDARRAGEATRAEEQRQFGITQPVEARESGARVGLLNVQTTAAEAANQAFTADREWLDLGGGVWISKADGAQIGRASCRERV